MKSVRVLFAALFVLLLSPATLPASPPPAAKPAPIGRWNLERWSAFEASDSTLHPWVAFKPNGALEASDGCFSYTGRYQVVGRTLSVDKLDRLPGGCASKGERWFDALTNFFPIELASRGDFNLTGQQLIFNTERRQNFIFRASTPAPARAPVALPPSSAAKALVASDFARLEHGDNCTTNFETAVSIKAVCMAVNRHLTNCRAEGPTTPEMDRLLQCTARWSVLKPGIDGPVTISPAVR